ncbi:MAG: efflux RND transporter permease subunit, partial [Planctomycetaceae bacterium]|nr:efflux RND transporter permease subunit [Planctomycetaceae bacterium]
MIEYLIQRSLYHRWFVLGLAMVVIGFGLFAFRHLPIDAYPDISPQKVSVVTAFPGRAPEEIERQVTIPIEIAMRNVPKVESVRSQTIFGLSCVDLIFEEGTELYWARQQVGEKLKSIELPEGADSPEIEAPTSACGEIFRYELITDGSHDVMDIQTINNWVVIPRLLRVPGVADVSNFGGLTKQYAVIFKPAQLEHYDLTLGDIVEAIEANNASAGGSVLRRGSMDLVIRSAGYIENAQQIEDIFVKSVEFLPYMDEGTIWVKANFPDGTSLDETAAFGKDIRKIVLEYPDVDFISMQIGRADAFSEPFPCSRIEMMVAPKPQTQWTQYKTKQEIIAALGKRLRDEFPTTRFAFTQPIIDMVTQDTNGTSAQLAVEISGDDFDVLSYLANQTLDLLRSIPGAQDVNIEQEGPQAQLQIVPDRRLCARYNVKIEDVTRLINIALGGDPIGVLYEDDRRFDIVVKLDRQSI